MQIKSWQISLIVPILHLINLILLIGIATAYRSDSLLVFGIFLIPLAISVLVSALLYRNDKWQKLGAELSIILGVLVIIASIIYYSNSWPFVALFYIPGILSIAAGIHYFWKKV